MSPGTSMSTGPGRPLRAMLNARRRAGTIISGVLIVSACLTMCWKFNAALKFGRIQAWPRAEAPGMKILAVSGNKHSMNASELATALETGADHVMIKPISAADLIQVDFPDFRPLRWYRCATSLFLHRDFRAQPRYERLPQPLIEDGHITVPDGPGLGFGDINEEFLREHLDPADPVLFESTSTWNNEYSHDRLWS